MEHLRIEGLWVVGSASSLIVGLPIPPLRVLTLGLPMLGLWGYPGSGSQRRAAPNLRHHRGGEKAKCWPGAQSKMFVFFGSARSAGISKHCRQEMLLSSETCWAHDLGGIVGFGVLEAPVSNTSRLLAEISK